MISSKIENCSFCGSALLGSKKLEKWELHDISSNVSADGRTLVIHLAFLCNVGCVIKLWDENENHGFCHVHRKRSVTILMTE
jgi:hypothetical protein